MAHPLIYFYVYTLKRSLLHLVTLLIIPGALISLMTIALSFLNDPVNAQASSLIYKVPQFIQNHKYAISISPINSVNLELCDHLSSTLHVSCTNEPQMNFLQWKSGAFKKFADELQKDIGDEFNSQKFTDDYEQQYIDFFGYKNDVKELPLYQININLTDKSVDYNVSINDNYITSQHRNGPQSPSISLTDFDGALFFTPFGTFLQQEIDYFFANKISGGIEKMELKKLETSSVFKQKNWQITFFALFGSQAFSFVLLGLILHRFRYFWLVKRLGIHDLRFWSVIIFIGVILMEIAFIFQIGFSKLTKTLPYAAYSFEFLFVVYFVSSYAIASFIAFLTVLFENQSKFTILTTAICLAFSIFPVLLSIFGVFPKSLFDDSFIPQIITYIFVILCPVLSNQAFSEYLLLMLDNDDIQSQRPYNGKIQSFKWIFSADRNSKEIPEIFTGKLFSIPPIYFYLVILFLQGFVYQLLTVYVSYIKKELKQFGLPWNFLFKKQFWQQQTLVMDQQNILKVESIEKRYKKKVALKSLDLQITNNSICGVIGATGSGKTTLLNILAGYQDYHRNPSTQYNLFGNDMNNPYIRLEMLSKIAICPQDKINMFSLLSVKENITIFSKIFSINPDLIEEFLDLLNLRQALYKTFYQLSGGMQRRFALLCSLLQSPDILLLDEMTANVDPLLKRNIWDTIHKYYEIHQITIILTSHDSNDINNIADYVAFLENGQIIKQGLLHEFIQDSPGMKLIVNYNPEDFIDILKENQLKYFVNWDGKQTEIFIKLQSNQSFKQVVFLLKDFPDEQYSIVSYPINEVLYKSYDDQVDLAEKQPLQFNEILIKQTPIAKHFSYLVNAILSKFYEARATKFVVFLISCGIIIFFSILQLFIMKSVRKTQVDVSDNYAQIMRGQSFIAFKAICQLQDANLYQDVFDCITLKRQSLFTSSIAQHGPQTGYYSSAQHYLDIVQFDNIQDYSFSFGKNSFFLSDYGNNYHIFLTDKNEYQPLSQQIPEQIQIFSPSSTFTLLQNQFQYQQTTADINQLITNQKGLQKYFSKRLTKLVDKLVYSADVLLINDTQLYLNQFVNTQNNNTFEFQLKSLSQEQIIEQETQSIFGIIDPDKNIIYITQPGIAVEKFYVITDLIYQDQKITYMKYFRHRTPFFDGPWFIDMDPVYSVQYNNDVITKTYEALIRQKLDSKINNIETLYNDVFISSNWNSMPKFVENTVQRPEYALENSNAYFTFMYFAPWIQSLVSIVALQQIHQVLDQFKLAFINGISISIFVFILSKLLIEIIVYSVKTYILFIVMSFCQPATAYTFPLLWVFPLLYSVSTVCFLYFIELLLSNYSISCLYVGVCTVIVVLVNPIMQPSLVMSLFISLFVPGFYYIVAARMNALLQEFETYYLVFGVLLSFGQFFLLLLIKYLTTIKNSLKVKKIKDDDLVLTASHINAYYSKKAQILQDFNLQIGKQQTTCLVGANGCGKSTFTKCLTGYQVQFTGDISISSQLGIVPQDDAFDRNLTVYQNLKMYSVFSGRDVDQLMENCGLIGCKNTIASQLSAGTARILTIACVLITNPKLLILDEVTVGLDFAMKKQVWQAILTQKCSCIIITHDMLEIEALGDHICIMQGGKIINSDSLRNTLKEADSGYVLSVFQEIEDTEVVHMKNQVIKYFNSQAILQDVADYIENKEIQYGNWSLEKISMESVFLHIIGLKSK